MFFLDDYDELKAHDMVTNFVIISENTIKACPLVRTTNFAINYIRYKT